MSRIEAQNGITQGVIWKQLALYFFPILLGTFFQQLYNTVDAVIVGQFVGKEALAAVGGATGAIINLLVGFFVGLSSGATVIISQYYGAQRTSQTSRAVHTSIALALSGGVVLMVAGIVFARSALELMGTPADIMEYAVTYLRIYFSGIIFTLIYNIGSGILRAVGDAKRPLYFLIIGCIINVVLDLFFVVVLNMGVMGVGIATVLAQMFSAILVIVALLKTDRAYKLILSKIRFDVTILQDIIYIGLPAGLQSVMYSASNILIQSTMNSFGTDTVAAWTAYGKIDGLFWMIMGAFGVSITTFSGQNFGAQKYDRIRKSVKVCLVMAFAASALMSAVLMLTGKYVFNIFTSDPAVIADGLNMMETLVPFYFTYVCVEVIAGAVRGTGDSIIPMIMTCFGICVLRIVWLFTAVPLDREVYTVVMSYPITWVVTSIMFLIYYMHGGWLKRRIKKAGFSEEK